MRDSVSLARARFLKTLLIVRPHVILDLYASSFAEFIFAVAEHFKERLVKDPSEPHSNAFMGLLNETLAGIESNHEPVWLARVDDAMRELIERHRSEVVVAHLKGKLTDWQLVELASLPLMRAIGTLMHVGDQEIAVAFRDWKTVIKLGHCEALIKELKEWSLRWNLDADWCRDHGLKVLRKWLMDDPLRWTFLNLDPNPPNVMPTRNSRLTDLWDFAAKSKEFDAGWSQATLSGEIFQGDPEDFSFEHKNLFFKAQGFNPIVQDVAEWKRAVELDFRIYLYESELNRLRKIKATKNQTEDLQSSFSGVLNLFKKEVSDHVQSAEAKVKEAKAALGLLRVKEKRHQDKHFEWTVRYQIPKNSSLDFELESEIADQAGVTEAAVSKAVTATLKEIALPIRLKTPKTDTSSRIARQLNQ